MGKSKRPLLSLLSPLPLFVVWLLPLSLLVNVSSAFCPVLPCSKNRGVPFYQLKSSESESFPPEAKSKIVPTKSSQEAFLDHHKDIAPFNKRQVLEIWDTITSDDGSLIGSVDYGKTLWEKRGKKTKGDFMSRRIYIIADTKKDMLAQHLVPKLVQSLKDAKIPNLQVLAVEPKGGVDSLYDTHGSDQHGATSCAIVFCTSFVRPQDVTNLLDELFLQEKNCDDVDNVEPVKPKISNTHIVGISTFGSSKYGLDKKFPHSVINFIRGADHQRRQIEDAVIHHHERHQGKEEPTKDYTLLKLDKLVLNEKDTTKSLSVMAPPSFDLHPTEDSHMKHTITVDAATQSIVQAAAFQPLARNSTLFVAGALPSNISDSSIETFWNVAFLGLHGPELARFEKVAHRSHFNSLVSEIQSWAQSLAENGESLTTPVQAFNTISPSRFTSKFLDLQGGAQLLFLPTEIHSNFEGKEMHIFMDIDILDFEKAPHEQVFEVLTNIQDGGVEVVVEATRGEDSLRVRVRRCNYSKRAVRKEMSEKAIIASLQKSLNDWQSTN